MNKDLFYLLILLIIFIVVLIIFIKINNKSNYENFSNNRQIIFLRKNETCSLINNIDYFYDFTEADIYARKLVSKKNAIFETYCDGFKNFTKNDKDKITNAINTIDDNDSDNELLKNFSFAKISRDVEFGYPHTHKDTIFMSHDTIHQNLKDLIYVIVHEQMHVMQRKKPEAFKNLYLNYLNFKQGRLVLGDSFVRLIRSNPDTRFNPDNEFIYDDGDGNYYYLNAFFKANQPDNLGDVEYLAIKCNHSRAQNGNDIFIATSEKTEINSLKNFNRFFNISGNHYHPNEISAELISFYFSNKNKEPSPALMMIDSWIKNKLI